MHYANGREAKIGDLVVGSAYNTRERSYAAGEKLAPHKRLAGTLVKAAPGSDYCNAEIEWIESVEVKPDGSLVSPAAANWGDPRLYKSSGNLRAHFVCRDYTHVGLLLHIEDVIGLELGGDGYHKPIVAPVTPAADHPAAADQA